MLLKKNHCLEWKLAGNHRHFEASLKIKLVVLFLRNQRHSEASVQIKLLKLFLRGSNCGNNDIKFDFFYVAVE